MNNEVFRKEFSEKELMYLNRIISNNCLTIEQRKYLLDIGTRSYRVCYICKRLCEICEIEKITDKIGFSEFFNKISFTIGEMLREDEEKLDNFSSKLDAMISVAKKTTEMEDKGYFELLTKVIEANIGWRDRHFIIKLFEINFPKEYINKRYLALEVALCNDVRIMDRNSNLEPYVWSILTNQDVLSMDEETYKKAVELAIVNIQSYPLYIAIKNKNLNNAMKKEVINYYEKILNKYFQKYHFASIDTVKRDSEKLLINIVNKEKLWKMSDEDYKTVLDKISKSKHPVAIATIINGEDISLEQQRIAFDFIENSAPIQMMLDKNEDFKLPVAESAISLLLRSMDLETYKRILSQVNELCEKAEKLYKENDTVKSSLAIQKASAIANVLNSDLYEQDTYRFLIAMNAIIDAKDKYDLEKIEGFCLVERTKYYSDREFETAINIIQNVWSNNKDTRHIITQLFLNDNVPFMEDKTDLFLMAKCENKEELENYIKRLDEEGTYHRNMLNLFRGVDEKTLESLIGDSNVVRKLGAPTKN